MKDRRVVVSEPQQPVGRLISALSDMEIAWIAGFLEGEGTFQRQSRSQYVRAAQVELEPLVRIQYLLGGTVSIYDHGRKNESPCHTWVIGGERARATMQLIRPYMSSKRQAQIDKAMGSGVVK